jgi:hypothetical protein
MDTFTESPSSYSLAIQDNTSTRQEVVLYSNPETVQLSTKKVFSLVPTSTESDVSTELLISPNPLILADRNKALQTIQTLLSTVQILKEKIQESMLSGPVCPYQQTLLEYLGPEYKCLAIQDIPYPKTFSTQVAISSINLIGNKYDDVLLSQMNVMSAEAADTNFVGVTSQNLGHAFAVLSSTSNGQEYVIDKVKTANHLEFAELIRNIPVDYIIQNPLVVAHKLISRYIEINQN